MKIKKFYFTLENSPRSEFFSSDYTNSLKTLIRHLTKQVRDKSSTAFSLAKFLNLNVSLFLKDLISILDRGLVFELVRKFHFVKKKIC